MVRLSPSEGLPATWEMELRNCRLASTGSTTVVVTIPSSGLPERTARCCWQRSSNCSGVSLRCVSRHFSAASLASRGPAPLTASSNAARSAPSGGLVTASNNDSAEAAEMWPLLTAFFSSGDALNASPNRTREAASPYEVLVRPASQSAMLRAPVPSHTRCRSASATTTACNARTRSRCCCNPSAPAANESRDSECTLTIATAVAPSSSSSRDVSTVPVLSNTSSDHNPDRKEFFEDLHRPVRPLNSVFGPDLSCAERRLGVSVATAPSLRRCGRWHPTRRHQGTWPRR
ncbi:unannotated protein [freshwater metagenome]|uniref:Unannotated protein n=1 Tax=freshwater metagenome TaxID=449393 RepID=A0A6J7IQR8_9ZZZZ